MGGEESRSRSRSRREWVQEGKEQSVPSHAPPDETKAASSLAPLDGLTQAPAFDVSLPSRHS